MLRPELAVLILAMADSLPVCETAASDSVKREETKRPRTGM